MVTRQISFVDIQERDDLDDLLRSLGRYANSTLTIDVASDIEALCEPGEFEALFASAHAHDIRIELVTDDPVRQELARLHGMTRNLDTKAIEPERDHFEATTVVTRPDAREVHASDVDVTQEYTVGRLEQTDWFATPEKYSPFDSNASFSFVTAPPAKPGARPAHAARQARPARRQEVSRSLGSSSLVLSVVVVAAAIAVLLVALLAPSASVLIVPETQPVSAEITYGLEGAAAGVDVAIQPTRLTDTITFEASAPTTGEAFVPAASARGMIFLTNPHTEVVELPAGTVFTVAGQAIAFVSTEAIEIPAADPFGSAQFGTAVAGIEATQPGPDGNVDTGMLAGTLESGIMFQNRFPLEGGSLRSVGVVTEQDLETLRAQAGLELEARLATALDEQIPEGWRLIEQPEMVQDIEMSFSAAAGATADSVTVQAVVDVAGDIYDPVALESAARERLLGTLTAAVPEGFGLVVDSIRLSEPQSVQADAGAIVLTISAEGTAEAQFPDDFTAGLKDELVGKGETSAERALQDLGGVESFSVAYGPDWLPWEPVPRLSNRVSVEIDGS